MGPAFAARWSMSRSEALNSPSAWSGCRKSWLAAARKRDFARLACSARSRLRLGLPPSPPLRASIRARFSRRSPEAAADGPALQAGKANQEGEIETEGDRESQVTALHRGGPAGGWRAPASRPGSHTPRAGDSTGWRRWPSARERRPQGTRRRRTGWPASRNRIDARPQHQTVRQDHPRCSAGPTSSLAPRAADRRRGGAEQGDPDRRPHRQRQGRSQARRRREGTKRHMTATRQRATTTEAHPARPDCR